MKETAKVIRPSKNPVWNLSYLLPQEGTLLIDNKIEEFKNACYTFINKWKSRDDYISDPVVLKEALDEYEKLDAEHGMGGRIGYYFELRNAQDQESTEIKTNLNKITDVVLQVGNDMEFFTHRIAKIPENKQNILLQSPQLKEYKHVLEILFKDAKYLLSEPEEKIVNLKSTSSYSNWVRMTQDFLSRESRIVIDTDGKKRKKSFSELNKLVTDQNKIVRDTAVKAFNDVLVSHLDVAEYEINSILNDKKVNDELRGIKRPDLIRHLSDDIDSEVVDALLESVESRFDISKRFYELKAKLMGVDKLEYHEKSVDYGSIDNKEYDFARAVEITGNVFQGLDTEFLDIFNRYIKEGLLDVFPKKGKAGGAFCASGQKNWPGYVLLNHTNKITDVMTLAHEMGHAINHELMRKSQNSLNFDCPTCTAEVASTFMEDFVLDYIEQEADNDLRLSIMMMRLSEDVTAIMRQVACYRFEQELHKQFYEKSFLSKKLIGDIFSKYMMSYLGEYVKPSPGSENWWIYWSHIRMFFYVYSYASGQLISKSLQQLYKKDRTYINRFKKFLCAGTSEAPADVFMDLGIDISKKDFWLEGLENISNRLDETWNFAKKMGKI